MTDQCSWNSMYGVGVWESKSVFKSCAGLRDVRIGEQVHGSVVKSPYEGDVYMGGALIDRHMKCGNVGCAQNVFDEMSFRNVVTWNSLITCYEKNAPASEAVNVLKKMDCGIEPDEMPDDVEYIQAFESLNLSYFSNPDTILTVTSRQHKAVESSDGRGWVYLVADNRLLKIDTRNIRPLAAAGKVLLGPETGLKGMNEIIGLAVSISSSCILINFNRLGLFAFTFEGKLKWSIEPVVNRMGYLYGCSKNVTNCYFVSFPVIDYCESNLYISNNHGEVYSMSIRSPHFKWIHDFSSLGKSLTVTAGNNGQLYVTVPEKAVILAMDVLSGTVLWQQSIGPLSSNESAPVADSNGWISIGSLDGFLYSISPSGVINKFPRRDIRDAVIQVKPVLDCSGYAVYISQTIMAGKISRTIDEYTYVSTKMPRKTVVTLLVPATGTVYWSESYPGSLWDLFNNTDLRRYTMDESILLAFLSIGNTGNPLSCFSTPQKLEASCSMMEIRRLSIYTGNEKAIRLFLFIETILLILVAALVRFCCVFWKKKKLQNQNLGNFLEKRSSLRLQKKVFDRTISELEKKAAAEGSSTNEVLEQLSDLVRERDGIKRKLSTTYSLGKDATSPESKSLIPLSNTNNKSFSIKSLPKERVTIFHTINDTSSEDGNSNKEEDNRESKGKEPMETESASDDGSDHEPVVQEAQGVNIVDDVRSGGMGLRRRSLSLPRIGSSM
ncbi:protein gamete expressed 3 [Tanacetum coccineum]